MQPDLGRALAASALLGPALACAHAATGDPEAPRPEAEDVVILYTNDFHGRHAPFEVAPGAATAQTGDPGGPRYTFGRAGTIGGFAALAGAVEQARQRHGAERVLLLHAGDTFSDDLLGNLTRGEAVVDLMNRLGYDFMALGNHDFDYGLERTRALAKRADFPMRAANVVDEVTGEPVLGQPWRIAEIGGVRVGLLALGYHHTPLTTAKENIRGLAFSSGVRAARRYVPMLRKRADLVVVVSHLGAAVDAVLAEEVDGIDLVVGGHSHDVFSPVKRVGGTAIVQALSNAALLGEAVLRPGEEPALVEHRVTPLYEGEVPQNDGLRRAVQARRAPHLEALQRELAVAEERIARNYMSDSPFDALAGAALIEATGADLALLPGVGYGLALGPGPVTREALFTLIPHPSKLAEVTLTGRQILQILEQSAYNVAPGDPEAIVGGLVQPADLGFTVDFAKPPYARISDVWTRACDGEPRCPLDPERRYRVATHSGMLAGLHRYETFADGEDIRRTERAVHDVVAEWMERQDGLRAPESQILRLEADRAEEPREVVGAR